MCRYPQSSGALGPPRAQELALFRGCPPLAWFGKQECTQHRPSWIRVAQETQVFLPVGLDCACFPVPQGTQGLRAYLTSVPSSGVRRGAQEPLRAVWASAGRIVANAYMVGLSLRLGARGPHGGACAGESAWRASPRASGTGRSRPGSSGRVGWTSQKVQEDGPHPGREGAAPQGVSGHDLSPRETWVSPPPETPSGVKPDPNPELPQVQQDPKELAGRKGGRGPPAPAALGLLTQWERLGSSCRLV